MIKFFIKGLLRDRSRSLFPLIVVIVGVCLTVLTYSFMNGVLDDLVDSTARFDTGHVKIVTRAYRNAIEQLPNDLALLNVDAILEKVRKDYPEMIFTPRIKFSGLLDIPNEEGRTKAQSPVLGIGIDIRTQKSPEKMIFEVGKSLVRGRMPKVKNEILISENLAQKLKVSIGETATLLSTTMYGSMVIHNFTVVGTIRFGVMLLDKCTIIVDLSDIRETLDMINGASEIVGYIANLTYNDAEIIRVTNQFNQKYFKPNDEFSVNMISLRDQGEMSNVVDSAKYMGKIFIAIFLMAISIILWNSGLVNGIRRYKEIGIRLAMGEPKAGVYRFMILESIAIGICGSIFGTLLGIVIGYYFQEVGLDYSSQMKNVNMMVNNVFRLRLTTTSYYIGFFPGIFAPALGTMLAGIGIYKRQTSQLFKEMEI